MNTLKEKYFDALKESQNEIDEFDIGRNLGLTDEQTSEILEALVAENRIEFNSFGLCSYSVINGDSIFIDDEDCGVEIIKFGNWIVTDLGIVCPPHIPSPKFISKDELNDVRPDKEENKYDWLLQFACKTWMTESDLYELNSAFFFAVEYFDLRKLSIVETLKEQRKEFNFTQSPSNKNSKGRYFLGDIEMD